MAQPFIPDLNALQQALDNVTVDDVSPIMPFIQAVDKLANSDDRNTIIALLRTTFWTEKSNTYVFTDHFKLLSAQNLSIIINKIGDKKMQKFIFIDNNKAILSLYPLSDLISLLGAFYSDRFANFVFNQFKGFLKARLSFRIKYFKVISVCAIIMILKTGGVGKSLSADELIIIAIKLKTFLTSNANANITGNTWLDCQSILPEIIELTIGCDTSLRSLTISNLQCILDNDLIVNMDQAKNIIHHLLSRQVRREKAANIGGSVNISKQLNCDKLLGILSTDNFASFQQPMKNVDTHMMNARVLLDGPLVIIPMDDQQNQSQCASYSVLVQIQDLNPLFDQQRNNNIAAVTQPKGSIFIVLLQQIPSNYEVVLFVSNSFESVQLKDLNIGMNNLHPVCIIPWPIPKIGRAVSFKLHCKLRRCEKEVNNITYGTGIASLSITKSKEIAKQDNGNDLGNLWNISASGNKMAMCIYSGQRWNNSNNSNRLAWINIVIDNKMTFGDMIDSATAQLGLPPPSNGNNNGNDEQKQQQFGWVSNGKFYVLRNQMGHRCDLKQIVSKYLDDMVLNLNLFPVFVFTTGNKQELQQRGAPNPFGGGMNFGGMNLGGGQQNIFGSGSSGWPNISD